MPLKRFPIAPILVAVLLFVFLAGITVMGDFRSFARQPLDSGPAGTAFVLAPGTSYSEMVRQLMSQGLTTRSLYWRLLAWGDDLDQRMQAGEYWIEPGTTPTEFLHILVSGGVRLHAFTIIEGWTFEQLREALAASDIFRHGLNEMDDMQIMAELGRPGVVPEGRFLPETYHLPKDMVDLDFLRHAMKALDLALDEAWNTRDIGLPYEDPEEVLIMASIIEKETAVPEERPLIAGVFVRRLQKGMRLQTDPTVIYGLGPDFDGNIKSAHLTQDTPYNTYTRHGLPPTPIAMPGKAALEAAVHPAAGTSLFFVATGNGQHVFSDTLEEHNQNVARYQKRKGSK